MIQAFAARAVAAVVVLAVSSPVWAQSPLPDLSLDDLMKLDAGQVYGASERLHWSPRRRRRSGA
jgi:hypothetical protein